MNNTHCMSGIQDNEGCLIKENLLWPASIGCPSMPLHNLLLPVGELIPLFPKESRGLGESDNVLPVPTPMPCSGLLQLCYRLYLFRPVCPFGTEEDKLISFHYFALCSQLCPWDPYISPDFSPLSLVLHHYCLLSSISVMPSDSVLTPICMPFWHRVG